MKRKYRLLSPMMLAVGILVLRATSASANAYEGLWVGQVALSHVNEVSTALDEDNIPIAPDAKVPTPTHDEAYLRLILHVNGAGQVNLLKDVAILKQNVEASSGSVISSESDYVLVTDERLYADFPQQEAVRIASIAFDFGDHKATDAVDVLVETISAKVAAYMQTNGVTATSSDEILRDAEDTAQQMAEEAANALTNKMNVAVTFDAWLRNNLASGPLTTLATTVPLDLAALRISAETLRTDAFYSDERALFLLDDLEGAVSNAVDSVSKQSAAHNLVARYADVENKYQRFVTGRSFGDMISDAAQSAASNAVQTNANAVSIRYAVNGVDSVVSVRAEAINTKIAAYDDTAATNAVETVLNAIIASAAENASPTSILYTVTLAAETAGLSALKNDVPRYALQVEAPSSDYTDFIESVTFNEAVEKAARAAALAAVKEAKKDPFHSTSTLYNAARIGAVNALSTAYAEASRAHQTELPMEGAFGPGIGDTRQVSAISNLDVPLGSAALMTTLYLPAAHPTNPFRHRRNPDHTTGFNIQRNIRIDFDGNSTNQLERVSTGVDQITGTYREEIFGLYKPLGPAPFTNPIGLKVEGTFQLNRVSHIDTLNSL